MSRLEEVIEVVGYALDFLAVILFVMAGFVLVVTR